MKKLAILPVIAALAACSTIDDRRAVATADAPAAIGPYSQGIRAGSLFFVSGQIPLDPATGEVRAVSVEDQTRRVMDNVNAILAANGMSMANVVSTTVYLRDLKDFTAMNGVYGSYFAAQNAPARATVQVARLPRDVAVEISAIAVR